MPVFHLFAYVGENAQIADATVLFGKEYCLIVVENSPELAFFNGNNSDLLDRVKAEKEVMGKGLAIRAALARPRALNRPRTAWGVHLVRSIVESDIMLAA